MTYFYGDWGDPSKPTTLGGDLDLKVEDHVVYKKEKKLIKNSKDFSRWSPGVMTMVASSLLEEIFGEKISMRALSWQEHIAVNHAVQERLFGVPGIATEVLAASESEVPCSRCPVFRHSWSSGI